MASDSYTWIDWKPSAHHVKYIVSITGGIVNSAQIFGSTLLYNLRRVLLACRFELQLRSANMRAQYLLSKRPTQLIILTPWSLIMRTVTCVSLFWSKIKLIYPWIESAIAMATDEPSTYHNSSPHLNTTTITGFEKKKKIFFCWCAFRYFFNLDKYIHASLYLFVISG